jgi:exosortase/archaeosortase family protein
MSVRAAWARSPAARFAATWSVLVGIFFAFSHTAFFEHGIRRPSLEMSAELSAASLRLLGENAIALENELLVPGFTLSIWEACDVVQPLGIFAAAVLASPVAGGLRLIGVLGGTLLLFLLNQMRILSLYFTGIHHPAAFDAMHTEVWQGLFIVVSLALWLLWAQWSIRQKWGSQRAAR